MTFLEFSGAALITFGPGLAMFGLTVAHDPIKVILLISASFFWLLSFLVVSICWSIISTFFNNLFVGAFIAVASQEAFRYLFYFVTRRAEKSFDKMMKRSMSSSRSIDDTRDMPAAPTTSSTSANIIQINNSAIDIHKRIPVSYVSGLGFGLMSAAFSMMNVLTDYIGPGTVGIKGDSTYFLLVSSLTASAFLMLNVAWSILMSESIEKSDKKLFRLVLTTHSLATSITFLNSLHLQIVSLLVIYIFTILSGAAAFRVAGFDIKRMMSEYNRSPRSV